MEWLNVGSLVLGLIAWILPVVALMQSNKQERRNWVVLCVLSLSACAISLCLQIFYTHYLMTADWTALLDTMGAVAYAAGVLLIFTILLNVSTLIVYRGRTTK
jgi:glucose uptake protein GlcU